MNIVIPKRGRTFLTKLGRFMPRQRKSSKYRQLKKFRKSQNLGYAKTVFRSRKFQTGLTKTSPLHFNPLWTRERQKHHTTPGQLPFGAAIKFPGRKA